MYMAGGNTREHDLCSRWAYIELISVGNIFTLQRTFKTFENSRKLITKVRWIFIVKSVISPSVRQMPNFGNKTTKNIRKQRHNEQKYLTKNIPSSFANKAQKLKTKNRLVSCLFAMYSIITLMSYCI